jgi:hypothetical protein
LRPRKVLLFIVLLAVLLRGCGGAANRPAPPPEKIHWHGRDTEYNGETTIYPDGHTENHPIK